jgi:hypothetical protein
MTPWMTADSNDHRRGAGPRGAARRIEEITPILASNVEQTVTGGRISQANIDG